MTMLYVGWIFISVFVASFAHRLIYFAFSFRSSIKTLAAAGIDIHSLSVEDCRTTTMSLAVEAGEKYRSNIFNALLRFISGPCLFIGIILIIVSFFV